MQLLTDPCMLRGLWNAGCGKTCSYSIAHCFSYFQMTNKRKAYAMRRLPGGFGKTEGTLVPSKRVVDDYVLVHHMHVVHPWHT